MRIGYVCTNFNNSEYSIAAVESLRAGNHEVICVVVDNASQPTEREKLSVLSKLNDTHVILHPSNSGYFAGLNIGLDFLRRIDSPPDWVVIGNNDLIFPDDFCDRLSAELESFRRFPVISPDIVTIDAQHQNPHVIESISRFREVMYDLYYSNFHLGRVIFWLASRLRALSDRSDESHWQESRLIYQGYGACYLLGPRFFELFSSLWAPTFMMSEEFFLSKQLSDSGEKIFYSPRIRVTHCLHGSLANLPGRARWQMARDAHKIYRKYVRGL